jgi:hypothetical protein
MSERWKHQIKAGWAFGIFMPVITTAFDAYGTSFFDAFFSAKFLVKLGVFLILGIFVIGYSSWREKAKNEMYNRN